MAPKPDNQAAATVTSRAVASAVRELLRPLTAQIEHVGTRLAALELELRELRGRLDARDQSVSRLCDDVENLREELARAQVAAATQDGGRLILGLRPAQLAVLLALVTLGGRLPDLIAALPHLVTALAGP